MSTPGTSHVDPAFIQVFGSCLEMLRKVVLTSSGQPFILSGSGTLGWDTLICNLMEPGDEALIVNTGYFGDRFGDCCDSYGFKFTHVRPPKLGDVPATSDVESAIKNAAKPFKIANITQVDTSTGVLTDVRAITAQIKKLSPDTLVLVDGVCSIGAEELRMDEWGVDAALTASQKALGTPSGLVLMVVSDKAMKVFESRKTPVRNYFASWKNWIPIMRAYEARKPSYFATPAVSLILALHVSLKQIIAQGMDARFKAHKDASVKFKDLVEQKWGMKLVPVNRNVAANSMTAIYYPDGVQPTDLLPLIVKSGVVVAGGLHPEMATKYFRVGHMGISSVEVERGHMQKVADVLESSLAQLKQN